MYKKHTKEILEPIILECFSWADVCRKIGLKPLTGSQSHIKKRAIYFGIDFTHFLGKSIIKGRASSGRKPAIDYCYNGSRVNSHLLRNKLIQDGIKSRMCEDCKNTTWNGAEIPLELHHIDGSHTNNDLRNLKIVCPNCHAQQKRVI